VVRISKKTFSKLEMVDLGWMVGFELATFLRVSRIDVRDAMIKLPEIVVSQYRRCCDSLVWLSKEVEWCYNLHLHH